MNIFNTLEHISDIYVDEDFNMLNWNSYIQNAYPNIEKIILNDFNQVKDIVSYENRIRPILNLVYKNNASRNKAITSFNIVTNNLNNIILSKFNKELDVDIILYLGLCNAAGWVTKINDRNVVLLGIEKIMELNWTDIDAMYGLIYHELGHVYQAQYGTLQRNFIQNCNHFLWQLFTEGIAMYFEQSLVGDFHYFHQDKDGWKNWCDDHIIQIKKDFLFDLDIMTSDNQKYFGDWVFYQNHTDVGYYLGARFIQFICKTRDFDSILDLSIDSIDKLFLAFVTESK